MIQVIDTGEPPEGSRETADDLSRLSWLAEEINKRGPDQYDTLTLAKIARDVAGYLHRRLLTLESHERARLHGIDVTSVEGAALAERKKIVSWIRRERDLLMETFDPFKEDKLRDLRIMAECIERGAHLIPPGQETDSSEESATE